VAMALATVRPRTMSAVSNGLQIHMATAGEGPRTAGRCGLRPLRRAGGPECSDILDTVWGLPQTVERAQTLSTHLSVITHGPQNHETRYTGVQQ